MMRDKGRDLVEERAAEWVARLDRLGRAPDEVPELQAWLGDDPARQGAFLRAQAVWRRLDGLGAPGLDMTGAETASTWRPDRRALLAGGMAAGVALLAGGGAYWARAERLTTRIGEVRRVPLADGSVATINTDSALKLGFEDHSRRIALGKGEAWFQVAKDPARPFVVEAGLVRVMAVGTAFSVRRRGQAEEIIVTEGVVQAWRTDGGERLTLAAGAHALISNQGRPWSKVNHEAAVDQPLAWREGEIVLTGEPLSQAIAEFNRYNARKLSVDDPYLASEALVGRFDANDPIGFAQAVSVALHARVVVADGEISLSRASA